MKTAIILHGMPGQLEYMDDAFPSSSNSPRHWEFPALRDIALGA